MSCIVQSFQFALLRRGIFLFDVRGGYVAVTGNTTVMLDIFTACGLKPNSGGSFFAHQRVSVPNACATKRRIASRTASERGGIFCCALLQFSSESNSVPLNRTWMAAPDSGFGRICSPHALQLRMRDMRVIRAG
jgi:hypothetical protein